MLQIEVVYIDPMGCQILVELGLLREGSLVQLFGPEGVLPQVLPVDAFHRIFLEQAGEQVVEYRGKAFDFRSFLFAYLLN